LWQIFYFGIITLFFTSLKADYVRITDLFSVHNILISLLALVICTGIGGGLYYLEQRFLKQREKPGTVISIE
jgi:hypothetical protein